MSDEGSDNELDLTQREFHEGQQLFGRYTLLRVLGRGGMGIVWLAHDTQLERDVALKFLPTLLVHDPALLSDLKRETKRSLELTHNNIVRIYDFVQDAKSACISMEYVDGETLSTLRAEKENKVFEPSELAAWVVQACAAIDYAHMQARVVHCDIKPSNLMVNSKGLLKITDFGIARSLSDSVSTLTFSRRTSGTLAYMSPQQLDGEKASHLDDIYSFGATLYELLAGKPPFYRGQIDRQIRERVPPPLKVRRGELDIVSGERIPEEWERTVAACLAKNPAQRPQSAGEVAERLGLMPRLGGSVPSTRSPEDYSGRITAPPSLSESHQHEASKAKQPEQAGVSRNHVHPVLTKTVLGLLIGVALVGILWLRFAPRQPTLGPQSRTDFTTGSPTNIPPKEQSPAVGTNNGPISSPGPGETKGIVKQPVIAANTADSTQTLSGGMPRRKAHIKWAKVNNDDWPEPKPPGKYEPTDDGAVVILPNGNKYITKTVDAGDGLYAALLMFPNGQVFSLETGGKGAVGPAFVNEDETLVAVTRYPATQTGDLHIYIKEPNGEFRGENGKYRELPNEENRAVNELLRETYDNFAGWTLEMHGIRGRTLTVWAIVKGQWIEKNDGIYRFEFKLDVAPDGKLALVK